MRNPVDILIGQDVDQVDRARIIAALGLDQPLWRQYLGFLNGALHGNLGNSFVYSVPAIQLILQRLPAINLSLFKVSLVLRLTRAGVREVLPQDWVRFARAKGLSPLRVVLGHVLRNTMIPLVTVLGLEFGSTIAFAVVTENIFAWPGAGKLILDSINALDRPVIVSYLVVVVCLFVTLNLIVDVLYKLLDPRVRLEGAA
jgi:ABC-type dipeptide/oligopeptide/nickel transport system permease component